MHLDFTEHTYKSGPNRGKKSTTYHLRASSDAYVIDFSKTMNRETYGVSFASTFLAEAETEEQARVIALHISKNTDGSIASMRKLASEAFRALNYP